MRKYGVFALTLMVVLSILLSSCQAAAPTAAPEPETVIVTQEVVVTKEVEVVVTKEVEVVVQATPAPSEQTYARNETLYTSGTQWGPPGSWNPFNTGGYAMGTFGLVYESMFLYDPLTAEYTPWLAESGEWTSDTEFTVKVRQGIKWADGEPFSAADIKYTFDMAKDAPVNISVAWDFLQSVETPDDNTVVFTFSDPLYQDWGNFMYTTPIIPKHIWETKTAEEITSGINENPVGTGPYVYDTHDQSRMVWLKRDGWWATEALGLDPKPKRIVDIVNGSNAVAMGMVLQGGLDLSNNFLPGVATLVKGGYGVQTYYPEPPYMLSANTAWLLLNLTKKPMDDVAFRKAMAYAIDTDQIVNVVYGNIVQKANSTGLLPIWDEYVDQSVVEELGFSYNPDEAKKILADAGYKDTDGDGFVEAPDGSKIELKVIVPAGWSDWMESIKVISNGAQAAGINLVPDYPDYGGYLDQRNQGTFDMMIVNDAQMSNSPFTYYNWMFMNPIADIATLQNGNYGRYDNQEAFDLVDELNKTKVDDVEGMKAVISQMQRIQLTDMPLIPLWYNGLWSQTSNAVWTNWPAAADGSNHYMPATWRGYWNMTSILMLCELELAGE